MKVVARDRANLEYFEEKNVCVQKRKILQPCSFTLFFFYKNHVYKNMSLKIARKIRS